MTQTIVHDDRTPAEIAYDSQKDGSAYTKPANDGPFGTDVTDEMIAALEAIERAADEQRSGQLYTKPADAAAWQDVCETIAEDFDEVEDLPLSPEEETIIDLILARTPPADATDRFKRGLINGYRAGREVCAVMADTKEYEEVPPVPAGYPTDRALLYKYYGDVFITIDRRDGEMIICHRGNMDTPIISGEFALALFTFFHEAPISELMGYLRGKAK